VKTVHRSAELGLRLLGFATELLAPLLVHPSLRVVVVHHGLHVIVVRGGMPKLGGDGSHHRHGAVVRLVAASLEGRKARVGCLKAAGVLAQEGRVDILDVNELSEEGGVALPLGAYAQLVEVTSRPRGDEDGLRADHVLEAGVLVVGHGVYRDVEKRGFCLEALVYHASSWWKRESDGLRVKDGKERLNRIGRGRLIFLLYA
jgi:hypothetical protein